MTSYGYSRGRSQASIIKEESEEEHDRNRGFTRSRRDRSVIHQPVDTVEEVPLNVSSASNTPNMAPITTETYIRGRRDDTTLSKDDPINESITHRTSEIIPPHDIDEECEEAEDNEDSLTRDRSVKRNISIEETLIRENQNVVFEGFLERKTNQKVLGKHLWETRYFKLSTHSVSIYVNNKTNITESVVKLSSIASINRNTKSDGTDLKQNRFDIATKAGIINLRSENNMLCQQWIHCLTQQRKKHRQSIRNGLQTLENDGAEHSLSMPVKRYKRHRTKRENKEENPDNIRINVKNDDENEPEIEADDDSAAEKQRLNRTQSVKITIAFEGFLIRRIGHNVSKMGEKIYFKLSDDALEFSKIEDAIDDTQESIKLKHQSNIMGSISIEHIKSVRMASDDNDEEFVVVFNENNSKNDWILSTQKQDLGNAKKWVQVLSRAQKEAEYVGEKINEYNDDKLKVIKDEDESENDDDSDEDESESEETFGTNAKRKKRKKLGGTIKALQNMINDETIDELEAARNQDLDQQKLVNGFEINNLDDNSEINTTTIPNRGLCSCLG